MGYITGFFVLSNSLYYITLFTFFLALVHFLSEVFIYHTAALTIGIMAPLMVASKWNLLCILPPQTPLGAMTPRKTLRGAKS